MTLLVSGATIIDGSAQRPIEGCSILIEGSRIKAIGRRDEFGVRSGVETIDARGKYVIPGLINANVHLVGDTRLENLARHIDQFEDLILESAQVALKNGLTTVFDTWGPRRFLIAARERINARAAPGSRIFCAGNIVGFDGPFSPDFFPKVTEVASAALVNRINAIWVENVGRHLMWLSPDQVAHQVRAYTAKGIDFIKYGSNEHFGTSAGAFLVFSSRVQAAIVEEAHRAGLTAQAHTTSVEGLRTAIEAGCNLIQHANHTGPEPIPEATLELLARRKTGTTVFPMTQSRLEWLMKNESYRTPSMWRAADVNVRNLIRREALLLLANDGTVLTPETLADPALVKTWGGPWEGGLFSLATGHFFWLAAMEEKGFAPMEILKAATRNVALAYGKEKDLGTLEPGKLADMLVLDKNPLVAAENYRRIHLILKDGTRVDRESLPINPIMTKPMAPPVEEEASYVPFVASHGQFPACPMCMHD